MERNSIDIINAIRENVKLAIVGKEETLDLVLTALLCGGHVLIEDVPGTGKTTMVTALSRSLGCSYSRIQFTPDVLPSDITGFVTYDIKSGEKRLRPGAIMSQIVMADEINRTSPKTQSSLLEAMQENQITIEGETLPLPKPFMVLATQNPVELTGTYPLPEAQLDRFFLKVSMGYPLHLEELEILRRGPAQAAVNSLKPVASADDILKMQSEVENIKCASAIYEYIVRISERTRQTEKISLGVSPRGSLALLRASKSRAMLQGRDYVIPDDVRYMAEPVLAHRIVLNTRVNLRAESASDVLKELLNTLPVPNVT